MSINLPGGKTAPTTTHQQQEDKGRTVQIDRLNKMSDMELQSKIERLPGKLKKKSESTEKQISKLREKFSAYESFKKSEVAACKKILEDRKKVPAGPNVGQTAKAA